MTKQKIASLGAPLAGLCAVHCAVLPIGVSVLPALGLGTWLDHRVELAMLALVLPLAAFNVFTGTHRRRSSVGLFLVGTVLLALGTTLLHESSAHAWANMAGGLFLAAAQLVRGRCTSESCHQANETPALP